VGESTALCTGCSSGDNDETVETVAMVDDALDGTVVANARTTAEFTR
jgi:hypothetical protein